MCSYSNIKALFLFCRYFVLRVEENIGTDHIDISRCNVVFDYTYLKPLQVVVLVMLLLDLDSERELKHMTSKLHYMTT